jgi:hypothetical protein
MAIFGKNGIVRKQEVAFARKLLVWKYEKSGAPLPDAEALDAYAEKVVTDAIRMAKENGSTVLETLKNKVKDIRR